MPAENRRVLMTKNLLKESLLEMLEHESIHKISIRSLCELANINRSTFYKYYDSQYTLLHEMENNLLQQIEDVVSEDSMNPFPNNHLEKILEFLKQHLKLCKVLINSNADTDFQQQLLGLPSILERLENLMKDYNETEFSYIKTMILYGGYHIVVQWLENDCKETPQEMEKIIISLITKMIPA